MATTKRSSTAKRSSNRGTAARTRSGSSNGRAPAKKRAPAKRKASTRATSTQSSNGVPETIKKVANTAKRPAIAVGAAAAGVAGGLVLRSRTRRKTILGVPVPRSIGKTLSGIDAKSAAKTVGQASKKFAKTTKTVSKDLEKAGDQAERIGKILD
jgi:phosphoribosylcarboxyaminoimidazole (NCAIR) mutase